MKKSDPLHSFFYCIFKINLVMHFLEIVVYLVVTTLSQTSDAD